MTDADDSSTQLGSLYYYDDFEDGLLTGRTAPYLTMGVSAGTGVATSTSPISGTYSISHLGDGSDNFYNLIVFTETHPTFEATFDFKLMTQGAGTATPNVRIFLLAFIDANNYTILQTYYDGTYQVLRIKHCLAGAITYYGATNWLTGKLPVGTVYRFTVRQYTNSWSVWVNGVSKINLTSTPFTTCSLKGFGCNLDSKAYWDNIILRPWILAANYHGTEPTVGAMGSETDYGTLLDPDITPNDDTNQLEFSGYLYYPCILNMTTLDGTLVKSKPFIPVGTNTFQLGYDGLDKYIALRLRVYAECNGSAEFNISSIKFTSE
jgi:hypothetical protein